MQAKNLIVRKDSIGTGHWPRHKEIGFPPFMRAHHEPERRELSRRQSCAVRGFMARAARARNSLGGAFPSPGASEHG